MDSDISSTQEQILVGPLTFFPPKMFFSRTTILTLVEMAYWVEVMMFFLHNSMEYI